MKDYATNSTEAVLQGKTSGKGFVKNYILKPLFSGFVGFTIFFAILIITKTFAYSLGIRETLSIGVNDLILSSIGFVLLFVIRIVNRIKSDN